MMGYYRSRIGMLTIELPKIESVHNAHRRLQVRQWDDVWGAESIPEVVDLIHRRSFASGISRHAFTAKRTVPILTKLTPYLGGLGIAPPYWVAAQIEAFRRRSPDSTRFSLGWLSPTPAAIGRYRWIMREAFTRERNWRLSAVLVHSRYNQIVDRATAGAMDILDDVVWGVCEGQTFEQSWEDCVSTLEDSDAHSTFLAMMERNADVRRGLLKSYGQSLVGTARKLAITSAAAYIANKLTPHGARRLVLPTETRLPDLIGVLAGLAGAVSTSRPDEPWSEELQGADNA